MSWWKREPFLVVDGDEVARAQPPHVHLVVRVLAPLVDVDPPVFDVGDLHVCRAYEACHDVPMGVGQGFTEPGFEGVRDVVRRRTSRTARKSAPSFSAYHRGRKVVDLWGGVADETTGRPWNEDTMAVVFSTTKGVTAICAHKLAQEGKLDLDAPVAKYWPEFAQSGKEDIPVSYLLSHRAGLAWVDGEMTPEEAFAWEPVIAALEAQAPHWEPGTEHGYHATTYGWLVGEVIRRVTGKSVGTYFRSEIAEPLGLDFWIGLPESEEPRVAPLVGGHRARAATTSTTRRASSSNSSWARQTELGTRVVRAGRRARRLRHLQHARAARGRDPRRGRHRRRPFARAAVRRVRRRGRRHPRARRPNR